MKKKEKTVCQIIRFRGKIETFFVSIDLFASSINYWYLYWFILLAKALFKIGGLLLTE